MNIYTLVVKQDSSSENKLLWSEFHTLSVAGRKEETAVYKWETWRAKVRDKIGLVGGSLQAFSQVCHPFNDAHQVVILDTADEVLGTALSIR